MTRDKLGKKDTNLTLLYDLLNESIGVQPITSVGTTQVVGTASSVVLASNADRKYTMLQNISNTDIWVKLNGVAVKNTGIKLTPNSAYEMSRRVGNLSTGTISAISDSIPSLNLSVIEGS